MYAVFRLVGNKTLIGRIVWAVGVKYYPNLAPRLANSGSQYLPAVVTNRLCLLYPTVVYTLSRLNFVYVPAQALK